MIFKIFSLMILPLWLLRRILLASKFHSEISRNIYNFLGSSIGQNTYIQLGSKFYGLKNLVIGKNCFIGEFSRFYSYCEPIIIGDNVLIASGVVVLSRSHKYSEPSINIKDQGYIDSKVVIGSNVWIGANVVITAGAIIEDGCVIAAGSIVKGVLKKDSIYAGAPAKYVKDRF